MRKARAVADKTYEGVKAMLEVSIVWSVLVAMVALSHNGK
jgi:hypothetical protein